MADTGYEVVVVYDEENAEFFGRVTGERGAFTFIGRTPAEVKEEFRISFDDYQQFRAECGMTPDKSFAGEQEARLVAEVHQAADAAAEPGGMTLNEWLGGINCLSVD